MKTLQKFVVPVTLEYRGKEDPNEFTLIRKHLRVEVNVGVPGPTRTKHIREAAAMQMAEGKSLGTAVKVIYHLPIPAENALDIVRAGTVML